MLSNGIALIPSPSAVREFIRIQGEVRHLEPLSPVLGEAEYLPHITLLQGRSAGPLATAQLLGRVATSLAASPITFFISGVSYVSRGWYFLDVEPLPPLLELHNAVCADCLDRLIPPSSVDPASLDGYTASQLDSFMKFGYRYIGKDFRPHVTIGRTQDRQPSQNDAELRSLLTTLTGTVRFSISTVTSYVMGLNGGHLRTLDNCPVEGSTDSQVTPTL